MTIASHLKVSSVEAIFHLDARTYILEDDVGDHFEMIATRMRSAGVASDFDNGRVASDSIAAEALAARLGATDVVLELVDGEPKVRRPGGGALAQLKGIGEPVDDAVRPSMGEMFEGVRLQLPEFACGGDKPAALVVLGSGIGELAEVLGERVNLVVVFRMDIHSASVGIQGS